MWRLFIIRFCLIIIFLFSILFGVTSWNKIRLGNDTEKWVSANGTITKSEVIKNKIRSRVSWCTKIEFAYEYGGCSYTSNKLRYGAGCDLIKSTAMEFTQKHKIGQTVQVFVNPEDPEMAVLEKGVGKTDYFGFCVSILAGILGLGCFLPKRFLIGEQIKPEVSL